MMAIAYFRATGFARFNGDVVNQQERSSKSSGIRLGQSI